MNKKYAFWIVAIVFLLVCIHITSTAQELPSGQVEVVRSFQARLADTDKVLINAPRPVVDKKDRSYTYELIPSEAKISYEAPEIRPLAMSSEKLPEPYNGFLRGGFGYPLSPYAELGYFTGSDKFNFTGHLRHHSANDNNVENQRFMDNDLSLKGNYFLDQGVVIGGQVKYSLDDVFFYGYDNEDTTFTADEARRRFNTFDGKISIRNSVPNDMDINYWANFDFYTHSDNLGGRENGQLIRLGMEKYLDGKHPVFAEIITDLSSYSQDLESFDQFQLNNFFFVPGAAFQGDVFQLRAAVRIASHEDEFSFFPDVKASILLADGAFNIMAGANGDFHKNSFRNLTQYNPFLMPGLERLRNTSFLDYYGGFFGMLENIQYEVKAGYKSMQDMALFVPNFETPQQFLVLYDSVNTVYVKGNIQSTWMDQVTVGLTLGYNAFSPAQQERAWQIPDLESNLSVAYHSLDKKFRLTTEIYYMNGLWAPTVTGEAERLNTLFDLSVGADYMINKNFGIFAHLNNLASNRWRRWFDYPTYGINVLGGFSLRF